MANYQIFISYRRQGGFETANLIAEKLRNAGYSVFLDIESLREGLFNEQLLNVIEGCKDFILVLPEKGLERCANEEDWVRREIEHALKQNKNIIPVFIQGFEFPEKMPNGLEELINYQGVNYVSNEYFNAFQDRLKGFLKAKRRNYWRRYRKVAVGLLMLLTIVSSIIGYQRYQDQKLFERVCSREVVLMGHEFVRMHVALEQATEVKEEWEHYVRLLTSTSLQDTSNLRSEFRMFIKHKLKQLPRENSNLVLSVEAASVMTRHSIKTEEITVFYSSLCPSYYNEVRDYMELLLAYVKLPFVSETVLRNLELSYQSLSLSQKCNYIGYLGFLSTLPDVVYGDDFHKMRIELGALKDIPFDLSISEYEIQQESALKDIENLVLDMGKNLREEKLEVEGMMHTLNRNRKDFDKLVLSKEIVRINEKKLAVDEKRIELAEKHMALDEAYQRLLVKCTFSDEEDQGMMWGKILRLITNTRNTVKIRQEAKEQYELNHQEAIRTGVDPSAITEVTYPVSLDEIFTDIYSRLDLFVQFNQDSDPNVNTYVSTVKNYLNYLRKGKQMEYGILVIGTKDDEVHPVLKVGDIVLERKGEPVRCTDDYIKLKEAPQPNTLKVLRYTAEGKKAIFTKLIPETKILVGFADLAEIDL
ncbi:MAG: TIR domain-containing protein [Marinilabiliaceae bacterium]|nr:TIR domain-containing protein [Marinilabiliaceae bacterium]